jgi:hypothetical protein
VKKGGKKTENKTSASRYKSGLRQQQQRKRRTEYEFIKG